jgi:hypothetical protein
LASFRGLFRLVAFFGPSGLSFSLMGRAIADALDSGWGLRFSPAPSRATGLLLSRSTWFRSELIDGIIPRPSFPDRLLRGLFRTGPE